MHPGRWAPLGPKAKVFVLDKVCDDCKGPGHPCACIMAIKPSLVKKSIDEAAQIPLHV
jgi:hypothetical protein